MPVGAIGLFSKTKTATVLERFRSDPSVSVLLLHTKNAGNGLNLTEATHVFIVEPMLSTGLEAQAIGTLTPCLTCQCRRVPPPPPPPSPFPPGFFLRLLPHTFCRLVFLPFTTQGASIVWAKPSRPSFIGSWCVTRSRPSCCHWLRNEGVLQMQCSQLRWMERV